MPKERESKTMSYPKEIRTSYNKVKKAIRLYCKGDEDVEDEVLYELDMAMNHRNLRTEEESDAMLTKYVKLFKVTEEDLWNWNDITE